MKHVLTVDGTAAEGRELGEEIVRHVPASARPPYPWSTSAERRQVFDGNGDTWTVAPDDTGRVHRVSWLSCGCHDAEVTWFTNGCETSRQVLPAGRL